MIRFPLENRAERLVDETRVEQRFHLLGIARLVEQAERPVERLHRLGQSTCSPVQHRDVGDALRLGRDHAQLCGERLGPLEVGCCLAQSTLLEQHEATILMHSKSVAELTASGEQALAHVELAQRLVQTSGVVEDIADL